MTVELTCIHHASFRIAGEAGILYIDPWKMESSPCDGDVVFISHGHSDHCSPPDVEKVIRKSGVVLAAPDASKQINDAVSISPEQTTVQGSITIETIPAYNLNKNYHPKAAMGCGAIISFSGVRIYYAGDTDCIPEMTGLKSIDVALLPVGGTYTMNAMEAASAVGDINCRVAIPYHWGDIVGELSDAQAFKKHATDCDAQILKTGETIRI